VSMAFDSGMCPALQDQNHRNVCSVM